VLLVGLVALVGLGILVYVAAKSKSRLGHAKALPTTVIVGDRTFTMEGVNEAEWLLYGIGAPADGANDVIVDTVSGEAPPRLLARLSYTGDRGLVLKREAMITAVELDSVVVQGDAKIPPGDHVVEMKGRYAEDPDLPPDKFVVRVKMHVK
jgi:hypothetical protein